MSHLPTKLPEYFQSGWTALDIALTASFGIFLAVEYKQFNENRGRDVNVAEQILVGLSLTFLAALIFKNILGFIFINYHKFDIYEPEHQQ